MVDISQSASLVNRDCADTFLKVRQPTPTAAIGECLLEAIEIVATRSQVLEPLAKQHHVLDINSLLVQVDSLLVQVAGAIH